VRRPKRNSSCQLPVCGGRLRRRGEVSAIRNLSAVKLALRASNSRIELAFAEDGRHRDVEVTQVESVKATTAAGSEGAHREQCFDDRDERVRGLGELVFPGRSSQATWTYWARNTHSARDRVAPVPFPSDVQE
jgi:hypothetical protein